MKQVLIRQGRVVVERMPAPACGSGEVLVRTAFSLISPGTETAALESSAPEPAGTAWMRRARRAGEVVDLVRARGIAAARAAVAARLEGPSAATGYSLAGRVLETGSGVDDLVPGQAVACAGSAAAHHAEIVAVRRHLCVPVPEGVSLEHAASVTLGAIALQGVRQADVRLGEIVCVVGLGLLGHLSVALLRASGCRVIGVDVEPARVARAATLGLEAGLVADADDVEARIDHATAGHGCDAVLLTAATESSEPVRQAFRIVRRRGRVVVVGAVGLDVDRGPMYLKEAELRIACSYGPGRYDASYEIEGLDYPYAFVRWTENRNMEAYLALVRAGSVPVAALLDRVVPLDDAPQAYRALTDAASAERPLGVLLRYGDGGDAPVARSVPAVATPAIEGALGIALVGPGSFARAVHLPNLAASAPEAEVRAIVARTPSAAREAARRFAAPLASTSLDDVLAEPGVHACVIATRHDRHAGEAERALRAGKGVFLEKPAALDLESLAGLEATVAACGRPFTLGFNRRFAPDVRALSDALSGRTGPLVLVYRVNAGRLPADHWTLGPEGGGRLVGEACHMIDLARRLVGCDVASWSAVPLAPSPGRDDLPLGDNIVIALRYADGSLATIVYTSLGHADAGKETIEAHWDGSSARIDDFRGLDVHGRRGGVGPHETDKGHRELMRRFVAYAAGRAGAPIPHEEIFATSRLVLEIAAALRHAGP